MKSDTWNKLEEEFHKYPTTVAGPVPPEEVIGLERAIGFVLPESYKAFVTRYGGGIVGPYSVYGLRAASAMAHNEASAIDVTKGFRKQKWTGTDAWLIVSMDHAGNRSVWIRMVKFGSPTTMWVWWR